MIQREMEKAYASASAGARHMPSIPPHRAGA
jgi:hypothetical protein